MLTLHDNYGYAINPSNVCCAEKRNEIAPNRGPFSYYQPPSLFVHGKDCRMNYEFSSDSLLDEDFRILEKAMPGYVAEGVDGCLYLINMSNVFSVGPVDFNGVELHFSGGFRNVLSFKEPEKTRSFLIENVK